MNRTILFLVVAVACCGQTYENLNSVLWVQTSAEYRATTLGIYRNAEAAMLRALVDKTWTAAMEQTQPAADLPPAVILDLDETVFDNSALQAQMTAQHTSYTEERWVGWVAQARAGLVPGAAQFLASAHGHGVALFYVTNRLCNAAKADDPTVVLIKKYNLPFKPDRLLCRTDTTDKGPRRAYVARGHRVLLLLGDDFNDFVTAGPAVDARLTASAAYDNYWGERWFLIPNPTYGSWERAVGYKVDEKLLKLRK